MSGRTMSVALLCAVGVFAAAGGPFRAFNVVPLPQGNESEIRFRNAAAHDYRLRRRSPCKGTGEFAEGLRTACDLDGKPRTFSPCREVEWVDMGCYQSQYPAGGFLLLVR